MSLNEPTHTSDTNCCCSHQPASAEDKAGAAAFILKYWQPIASFILLTAGLIMEFLLGVSWFAGPVEAVWYIFAYLPVGVPVLQQAFAVLKTGDLFTEFFLMSIAAAGAFLIGEYPEGVAVMLFYSIGEAFQQHAVHRAKNNIQSLLDVRAETAHVSRNGQFITVHPKTVNPGEIIQVRPGERIPLDGIMQAGNAAFDTSALTGESKPRHIRQDETVLAGMINLNHVIEIKVTSRYENSSISRILEMVQNATHRKAKPELFIRSFARIYTPAVVFLAVLLVALPALWVNPYLFDEWLYRGLVFLVISCPCALVISIPLGYFGGIGAASRNGILVKGSNYLDALRSVRTMVFDKTGTLTKGTFAVQQVVLKPGMETDVLPLLLAVEQRSTHPVAKAIASHFTHANNGIPAVEEQVEIPGHGIRAMVDGRRVVAGNLKLMEQEGISVNDVLQNGTGSYVYLSIDDHYMGYLVISDQLKEDSIQAVRNLRKLGVNRLYMLSGDHDEAAQAVGGQIGLDHVYGGLLPEQKAKKLEQILAEHAGTGTVAYAGDGINDAPVLALSDVGIAMGVMGSDAAIETADVVIQSDQPSKIATAIRIGRATRNIVWQNISLAFGVKALVLGLGAFGIATLWEAVFADVGVALLAILNAARIQQMDFSENEPS